jgi:O-antigen ligase
MGLMQILKNDRSEWLAPLALWITTIASSHLYLNSYVWPKQIVLTTATAILLSVLALQSGGLPRWLLPALALLLLTSLAHNQSYARLLWGRAGSNIGLISWASFLVLAAYSSSNRKQIEFKRAALIMSMVIGASQAVVLFAQEGEFWPGKHSTFSNFYGTLGNSDYTSMVLGMAALASITLILMVKKRSAQWILLLIAFLVIYQLIVIRVVLGEVSFTLGLILIVLSRIKQVKLRLLTAVCFAVGMLFVGAGFFGYGPLGVKLQQVSLLIREVLWRGGILIWIHNPILGYGFDSYLEGFRRFRDSQIVSAFSLALVGEDAHNLILTLCLTLGLFGALVSSYLIVLVVKAVSYSFRTERTTPETIAVFSIFFGLFVAALATPLNLVTTSCLAYFAGFLIPSRKPMDSPVKILRRLHRLALGLFVLSAFALSAFASLPDFLVQKASTIIVPIADSPSAATRLRYYMRAASNPFAQESIYLDASTDLSGLGQDAEAFKIAAAGIKKFPSDFELRQWRLQSKGRIGVPDQEDKVKIRQLDPAQ